MHKSAPKRSVLVVGKSQALHDSFDKISAFDKLLNGISIEDLYEEHTLVWFLDDFFMHEVSGHECKFWVTTNHSNPDDNRPRKERMAELISALEFNNGFIELNDNLIGKKPENFYGAHVNSVEEAMKLVAVWRTQEPNQWPVDYRKPIGN